MDLCSFEKFLESDEARLAHEEIERSHREYERRLDARHPPAFFLMDEKEIENLRRQFEQIRQNMAGFGDVGRVCLIFPNAATESGKDKIMALAKECKIEAKEMKWVDEEVDGLWFSFYGKTDDDIFAEKQPNVVPHPENDEKVLYFVLYPLDLPES